MLENQKPKWRTKNENQKLKSRTKSENQVTVFIWGQCSFGSKMNTDPKCQK